MAFCTNCGAPLEEGVRFCTNCGAPVEPSEPVDDNGFEEGLDSLDETTFVEDEVTRIASPASPSDGRGPSNAAYAAAPQDTSTNLPPSMPPQYPEQPASQAPTPRRPMGAGAIVGITLGVVAAVLVVGFGLFYFTNPFGLTDGIFANSAAAQAAAAEEAQAQADEVQQQLEEAQEQAEKVQSENEELQKQLDEANRQDSGSGTVVVVPGGTQGSDG